MSIKISSSNGDRLAGMSSSPLGRKNINAGTAEGNGSLARMFVEGTSLIGSKKTDNLFQQLESRSLTEDEEAIIRNRVELQRRMLAAYERQEKTRKVQEIRNVHADLTDEEAEKALEICDGREEDAASQLASDPAFVCQVKAACKGHPLAASVQQQQSQQQRKTRTSSRPRKADTRLIGDQVFVGSFRGRGFVDSGPKPATKATSAPKKIKHLPGADPKRKEDNQTNDAAMDEPEALDEPMESDAEGLAGPDDSADVGMYEEDEAEPGAANAPAASEPQTYLLAKELSNGEVRPATTSEVNDLDAAGAEPKEGDCAQLTPPSITSIRKRAAMAAEKPAIVTDATIKGAVRALSRLSREKSLKFLQTMSASVATKAMAILKEQDPAIAGELAAELAERPDSNLHTIVEEEEGSPGGVVKEKLNAKRGKQGNADEETLQLQTEAEDAKSEEVVEAPYRAQVLKQKRSFRPTRAATAKALQGFASGVEDVEADGGEVPTNQQLTSTMENGSQELAEDKPGRAGATPEAAAKPAQRPKRAASKPQRQTGHSKEVAPVDGQTTGPDVADTDGLQAQDAGAAPTMAATKEGVAVAAENKAPKLARASSEPDGKSRGHKTAISARGHTNRGRLRQKSHKSAELVEVGRLRAEPGWYNPGYIFPEGFKSRVNFRSSVELDQLCVHECAVLGKGGHYWPAPTFVVVAMDRPEEPLIAKSCTGCWTGVLKRINGVIEDRRRAGEPLPPAPKTAIAGPEYFGFNQAEIQDVIEALDHEHKCEQYWRGKADREAHAAGLPVEAAPRPPKSRAAAGSKLRRKRHRGESSDEEFSRGSADSGEDEAALMSNKWSAVSRHERYRKRCGSNTEEKYVDQDNPLPGWIDPITLEPAVTPAISPWGHVMGMATWKAILSSSHKCPFTQRDLSWEQCQLLTKANIGRYKGRIVADDETLEKFGLR